MFLNGLDLEITDGDRDDPDKMDYAGASCSATKAFDEDLFAGDDDLDDIDEDEDEDEEEETDANDENDRSRTNRV